MMMMIPPIRVKRRGAEERKDGIGTRIGLRAYLHPSSLPILPFSLLD